MTDPASPLEALLELHALEGLPRIGWVRHHVPAPESVAGHAFGTALVALALGPQVAPPLAVDRAVTLALVHDVGEVRLGDLGPEARELLPEGAKEAAEARATEELLGALAPEAAERGAEVLGRETREARFVHLCDRLQLGLRLVLYGRGGVRGLDEFRAGLEALECAEFEPCGRLRDEILTALDAMR